MEDQFPNPNLPNFCIVILNAFDDYLSAQAVALHDFFVDIFVNGNGFMNGENGDEGGGPEDGPEDGPENGPFLAVEVPLFEVEEGDNPEEGPSSDDEGFSDGDGGDDEAIDFDINGDENFEFNPDIFDDVSEYEAGEDELSGSENDVPDENPEEVGDVPEETAENPGENELFALINPEPVVAPVPYNAPDFVWSNNFRSKRRRVGKF